MTILSGNTITGYRAQVISATDYSPFGVALEGRTFSSETYRYGFQAQEQDEELWEGAVTYKYRVEDPRLGRFFSVDPLYKDFPWNSNYAFSENRLFDCVELEGLEAYYIHGTANSIAGDYRNVKCGWEIETSDLMNIGMAFGNTTVDQTFTWLGENNDDCRHDAGFDLAMHILNTWDGKQPITLIGHSHGGNVSIEAANILIERFGIDADKINVVALNTPAERDISLKNQEVDLYAVSAYNDVVQAVGSDYFLNGDCKVHDRDQLVFYEDQVPEDYDAKCGVQMNHSGFETRNVAEWLPKLKEKINDQMLKSK